jgi:hypothetical protein
MSELREVKGHLQEIRNEYIKLENTVRKVALMAGCQEEAILPLVYDGTLGSFAVGNEKPRYARSAEAAKLGWRLRSKLD